jgi:hypothetical protein
MGEWVELVPVRAQKRGAAAPLNQSNFHVIYKTST